MRVETKEVKIYPHTLNTLKAGEVYETAKREGYFLATDEFSVVELSNGVLWGSSNWAGNAEFREVTAKVVIE